MLKQLLPLFIFMFCLSRGQKSHELGAVFGSANHIGDVGSVAFFNSNSPSFGIAYKLNQNNRISYRAAFSYLKIKGDDAQSNSSGRKQRGYSFTNAISEILVGLEFNFRNYSVYTENDYSPYLLTGLAYDFFDSFHYEKAVPVQRAYTSALALPLGLGIKTSVIKPFLTSAEIGVRYLFSDNLDGNNPGENLKKYRFGNVNDNDIYVFLNISLSVRLNKRPCFSCD